MILGIGKSVSSDLDIADLSQLAAGGWREAEYLGKFLSWSIVCLVKKDTANVDALFDRLLVHTSEDLKTQERTLARILQ